MREIEYQDVTFDSPRTETVVGFANSSTSCTDAS